MNHNFKHFILALSALALLFSAPAFAQKPVWQKHNSIRSKIRVTWPQKNRAISGYFIPVSWIDSAVESLDHSYPRNYQEQGTAYQVVIADKTGNPLLEKRVDGINFCVWEYPELKDVITTQACFVKVKNLDTGSTSPPVRFVYQKPEFDTTYDMWEAGVEDPTPLDLNGDNITADDGGVRSAPLGSCGYCWNQYWMGMLVLLLNETAYDKYITISCNETVYFNLQYNASFSGPAFVHIKSGENWMIAYNDVLHDIYRCSTIPPWQYTIISLP